MNSMGPKANGEVLKPSSSSSPAISTSDGIESSDDTLKQGQDQGWDIDAILDVESSMIQRGIEQGKAFGIEKARNEAKKEGREKGMQLGLEFGFYAGVVNVLRKWQDIDNESEFEQLKQEILLSKACQESPNRKHELTLVLGNARKPNVVHTCKSIETLFTEFDFTAPFSDQNTDQLLKIRSKFKILESRIGLVLDIMPGFEKKHQQDAAVDLTF